MRNIALIGKMGSGKSTAAEALVHTHGYVPLAFATPLKEMVIEADPLIRYSLESCNPLVRDCVPIHLSDILASGVTFEDAKRTYPEVRRSLQRIGQGVRKMDANYWTNHMLNRICDLLYDNPGTPIVVTDVRYPNEAAMLQRQGFTIVRVTRKPSERGMTMEETRAALHESETALDNYREDVTINNDGDILDLYDAVLNLV